MPYAEPCVEPYASKAGTKFVKPYAPKALHKAFLNKNALCALGASWDFLRKALCEPYAFFS